MLKVLAMLALCIPAWSLADTPFAGTWVLQPELTEYPIGALSIKVDHGIFQRLDCKEPFDVPADGVDHPVARALFDSIAVQVRGHNRLEMTQKVADRVTWRGVYTVSSDRRSLTLEFDDRRASVPVTGAIRYAREGEPAGMTALTGTWRPQSMTRLSDSGQTMAFHDTDNGIAMSAADGRSFEAKFDRQYYPVQGPLGETIAVGRPAPATLQLNMTKNGRPIDVSRATVADDGQSMTVRQVDQVCTAEAVLTFHRMPAP
jgi:hypothetical protein